MGHAIVLNVLMNCSSFGGVMWIYYLLYPVIYKEWQFFFSILVAFILFLSDCGVGTSNTMLNKNGKSGQSYLIASFKGKDFSFIPLSMMLSVGLSYMALMMLKKVSSIPTLLRVLIINECWTLSNAFFVTINIIMWFYSFNLCFCITLIICIC